MSKATEYGKTTVFSKDGCEINDSEGNAIAFADRTSSLYQIQEAVVQQTVHVADGDSNQTLWHQRFWSPWLGRLSQLVRRDMVSDFSYRPDTESPFCVPCSEGKQTRNPFMSRSELIAEGTLEWVHSGVCGKMGSPRSVALSIL